MSAGGFYYNVDPENVCKFSNIKPSQVSGPKRILRIVDSHIEYDADVDDAPSNEECECILTRGTCFYCFIKEHYSYDDIFEMEELKGDSTYIFSESESD